MNTLAIQENERDGSIGDVQVSAEADVETTAEAVELETDDLFHILQNQRRRRTLMYLQNYEKGEQVDMGDIAEQVAAWENDTTLQQLTSKERQRVYIALYQSHLPKLDEKGILDYNQSRGIVERTELADEFDPYLDVEDDSTAETRNGKASTETTDRNTPARLSLNNTTSYYGGATALGLILTVTSWVGLAPTVLSSYLATFITGMFAFITIGVNYQQHA